MLLNDTPSANRVHISFFGLRNTGKSSLLNAITNQNAAVVSEIKGTTTDPVQKAMELLPMGPVLLTDTPGIDDEQETLGALRIRKAEEILRRTDIAVLVTEAGRSLLEPEKELLSLFSKRGLPHLIVYNKADLLPQIPESGDESEVYVSAEKKLYIDALKEKLGGLSPHKKEPPLVRDLVSPGDFILLIIPVDKAAPKGRLILPQQQVIRELLDFGAIPIATGVEGAKNVLRGLQRTPALAITDSQVFDRAAEIIPPQIPLTSFSILFARYKGILDTALKGAKVLDQLKEGDRILISEGCTHHRQCGDIGTEKLPRLIRSHCKENPDFVFSSGKGFPENLFEFQLIIHCGGCMLNEKEMQWRRKQANIQHVPMTNYGTAIAHMRGILSRSLEIFNIDAI